MTSFLRSSNVAMSIQHVSLLYQALSFYLFRMEDADDAEIHAVRGSLLSEL